MDAHPPEGAEREFSELAQYEIDARSVRLLERDFCESHEVVVLGRVDPRGQEPVTVGMLSPGRRSLVAQVEGALGRPVQAVRLNSWEIQRALEEGYGGAGAARGGSVLVLGPVHDFSFERDEDVPRLLDEILGRAVQRGARRHPHRDLPGRRGRALPDRRRAPADDHPALGGQHPAGHRAAQGALGLDIAERRRAQDGRVQAVYREGGMEREVDFRLSVVPGPFGEDAVLRILDSSAPLPLAKLGLGEEAFATFERLIANPEGMILVTGPTGSGKTTTLYAAIHHINTPANKILTVEDPIEYHFPKTNQKQVSSWMSFADYARAFMRQNPDVILIGEIRDEETAAAAVRAAQTGHLVLSTLHTNDAVSTVSRLSTLGVPAGLIAACLLGAVSQRLVRRLCPACKVEAPPDDRERRRLGIAEGDGPFYRPESRTGCEICGGLGYKGRVGLYELFVLDGGLADQIAEGAPIHRIRAAALEKGMQSLPMNGLEKARAGVTSLEEILRVVPYRILATH